MTQVSLIKNDATGKLKMGMTCKHKTIVHELGLLERTFKKKMQNSHNQIERHFLNIWVQQTNFEIPNKFLTSKIQFGNISKHLESQD